MILQDTQRALLVALLAVLAGCASPPASVAPGAAPPPAAAPAALPTYADAEPLGASMEGWPYPYPVQMFQFEREGRLVRMAYMDVKPAQPNGRTVVLFHGKNFGGDYWAGTIRALSDKGYRVITPDQIGFGRSSKPEMRYTFAMLSDNTLRLLDHLKVTRFAVVAHSMGGMLGVHLSRSHPERVSALVLENPLGLEDYGLSIPPQKTPDLLKLEMAQTPASYRNFVKGYFPVNYKPEYEQCQLSCLAQARRSPVGHFLKPLRQLLHDPARIAIDSFGLDANPLVIPGDARPRCTAKAKGAAQG